MRAALVLIACAACGSPMPAAAPDAAVVTADAHVSDGRMVSTTTARWMSGSSRTTIPPTNDGDSIVVVVARSSGTYSKSVHVGFDTSADASGAIPVAPCGATTEVWLSGFFLGASAGTTDVVVDRDDDAPYAVVVLDFGPVNLVHDYGAHPVSADPGSAVLSTLTTCGSVTGVAAASAFTVLDLDDGGTSVAYAIPAMPGVYAAPWSYDGSAADSFNVALE